MAVLGGEFAAIVLMSMPAASLDDFGLVLESEGRKLNLHFHLKGTTQPQPMTSGTIYLLETISLDSPGIVQAVTAVLNKHGINIEELETETQPAPWSGTPTFHMRATVILGNEATVSLLKGDLNRLEGEKDLEISLVAQANYDALSANAK